MISLVLIEEDQSWSLITPTDIIAPGIYLAPLLWTAGAFDHDQPYKASSIVSKTYIPHHDRQRQRDTSVEK